MLLTKKCVPKLVLEILELLLPVTVWLARLDNTAPCSPQITVSVRPSVCPSVRLEYQKTYYIFNVGIKIRVSTWSHLSIVRLLQMPIPTYDLDLHSEYIST
jgi:hypothetical protein